MIQWKCFNNSVKLSLTDHVHQDRKAFKEKRTQQMAAATQLLKVHQNDYAKAYKMVEVLMGNLFKVLISCHMCMHSFFDHVTTVGQWWEVGCGVTLFSQGVRLHTLFWYLPLIIYQQENVTACDDELGCGIYSLDRYFHTTILGQ